MSEPIRILFFAGARERTGVDGLTLDITTVATVRDVRRVLGERFENLKPWLPKVAFAVNEEYAEEHCALKPGDIVAVIPPVSGG